DHTIFAKADGIVSFRAKKNGRTYVSVTLADMPAAAAD
ncbi:MAG TPA: 50S ribosomal protein L27, partial [Parvibaculum sp.]